MQRSIVCAVVVFQFAVAAVSDRRNLLNQKTAVRDRRYKESNCTATWAVSVFTPRRDLANNQRVFFRRRA
jgi:CxxC motif-containing protein (DUF1111 family)